MIIPKIIQEHSMSSQENNKKGLSYDFSEDEIKALAIFFRKNQQSVPSELLKLNELIEEYIYNSMSISEVKKFYSQD